MRPGEPVGVHRRGRPAPTRIVRERQTRLVTRGPGPYPARVHCHGAVLFLALALGPARPCRGADPGPPPPGVEAIVPVEPEEHERLHYFGRRHHHLVPGTVTIDRPPYVCDVDGRQFTQGDDFVAHLRAVHHARPDEIPELLLVRDGVVHFPGR